MALTLRLTEVRRVNGRIYIHFSDGIGLEFSNVAEVKAFAASLEENLHLLRKILLAYWLKRDDGSNSAVIEGKAVTLDIGGTTLLGVA